MTILGLLVVRAWRSAQALRLRLALAAIVAAEVVLVAIARLALNEHYPTDVLAGFLGAIGALGLYAWLTRPGGWADVPAANPARRGAAGDRSATGQTRTRWAPPRDAARRAGGKRRRRYHRGQAPSDVSTRLTRPIPPPPRRSSGPARVRDGDRHRGPVRPGRHARRPGLARRGHPGPGGVRARHVGDAVPARDRLAGPGRPDERADGPGVHARDHPGVRGRGGRGCSCGGGAERRSSWGSRAAVRSCSTGR